MISKTKRFAALVVLLALILGLTACGDTSWAARYTLTGECGVTEEQLAAFASNFTTPTDVALSQETQELSGGLYSAFVLSEYQKLLENKTLSQDSPISGQMVGEVSAVDYIDKEAKSDLMQYILASRQMARLGLTIDREADSNYEEIAAGYTENQSYFEKCGIGFESYLRVSIDMDAMITKLFAAKYGEGGYAAVSDDELLNYYHTQYMRCSYIQQSFYDESGAAFTEEQIAATKAEFGSMLAQFNAGTLDFDTVSAQYDSSQSSYQFGDTNVLMQLAGSDETLLQVMALPIGGFTIIEGDGYIGIYRHDITDDAVNTDFGKYRSSILLQYKQESFLAEFKALADTLTDVEVNETVFTEMSIAKLPLSNEE